MTKIERYKAELEDKRARLKLYKDMEVKMLTGSAQAYSVGSRSKTNYSMTSDQVRAALKELEKEIEELEGLISGRKSRYIGRIIPRC